VITQVCASGGLKRESIRSPGLKLRRNRAGPASPAVARIAPSRAALCREGSRRWGRPQARRPNPAGFSFDFAVLGKLSNLLFMPVLLGRGRRNRPHKSGGPPLFEPSLKVQRDNAHNQNSTFALPGLNGPQRETWRSLSQTSPGSRLKLGPEVS